MNSSGFVKSVVIAALLSLLAAGSFHLFHSRFNAAEALSISLGITALAYVIVLLVGSTRPSGKVVVLGLFSCCSLLFASLALPLALLIGLLLLSIWLIRSYFYPSDWLFSVVDMGLIVAGGVAANWAWLITGSWLLTCWCFFVVQALMVFIPKPVVMGGNRIGRGPAAKPLGNRANAAQQFQHGYQDAQTAISRLTPLN